MTSKLVSNEAKDSFQNVNRELSHITHQNQAFNQNDIPNNQEIHPDEVE
uniref:Uncharacterized protein n=1 Tax=Rhizophora mucronata TaxID=61149 RepID=A0A2P2QT98_RHIMU